MKFDIELASAFIGFVLLSTGINSLAAEGVAVLVPKTNEEITISRKNADGKLLEFVIEDGLIVLKPQIPDNPQTAIWCQRLVQKFQSQWFIRERQNPEWKSIGYERLVGLKACLEPDKEELKSRTGLWFSGNQRVMLSLSFESRSDLSVVQIGETGKRSETVGVFTWESVK